MTLTRKQPSHTNIFVIAQSEGHDRRKKLRHVGQKKSQILERVINAQVTCVLHIHLVKRHLLSAMHKYPNIRARKTPAGVGGTDRQILPLPHRSA